MYKYVKTFYSCILTGTTQYLMHVKVETVYCCQRFTDLLIMKISSQQNIGSDMNHNTHKF